MPLHPAPQGPAIRRRATQPRRTTYRPLQPGAPVLPVRNTARNGRRARLVDHVLRAARAAARDERIVLVIDGLDEAEHIDGDLPLGLPNTLPSGVFIIVTSRFGTDLSALRQPWKALAIDAADPRNIADLHRHLLTHGMDEPLTEVLNQQGMPTQEFVRRMVDRCGGVWVYPATGAVWPSGRSTRTFGLPAKVGSRSPICSPRTEKN